MTVPFKWRWMLFIFRVCDSKVIINGVNSKRFRVYFIYLVNFGLLVYIYSVKTIYMTQQQKVKDILLQEEYKVVKGKVMRQDKFDHNIWNTVVPTKKNEYYLVKKGDSPEMFAGNIVMEVIDSMNGAAMDGLHTNGKLPESFVEDGAAKLPENSVGYIHTPSDDGSIIETTLTVGGVENNKLINMKKMWDESVGDRSREAGLYKDFKPKKQIMTKEKTVKKLKKVIEKVTKKTAPKKPSSRKPYKTGLHRGNLSKENIEFIQNEARKEKGMTVADMAKKFGVGRLTVDHHWKKAAKWVKTKVLIPQKTAKK
jgi:hypothetical protein